jgi:hypothetical protein
MIQGPIGGDRGTTEPLKAGFLAGTAIATPQTAASALKGAPGALTTPDHAVLAADACSAPHGRLRTCFTSAFGRSRRSWTFRTRSAGSRSRSNYGMRTWNRIRLTRSYRRTQPA